MIMSSIDQDLHHACDRNDPYCVSNLLSSGASISMKDPKWHDRTPLIRAAIHNCYEILIIFLLSNYTSHSDSLYSYDDQGFNAFHWALIKGHVESISVMSYLNPQYLTQEDKFNRSPAYIFQHLKPLPHVIQFMKKWYPQLLLNHSNNSITSESFHHQHQSHHSNNDLNSILCLTSTSFTTFHNNKDDNKDDHYEDDNRSDSNSDSDSDIENRPSHNSKNQIINSRKSSWRSLLCCNCFHSRRRWRWRCCPSWRSCSFLKIPRMSIMTKSIIQNFSSLISKNSEELSKFPFRCFFSSILLSLYYVLFVFYPSPPFSSSSPSSSPFSASSPLPLPSYYSNGMYFLNLFGQLLMWFSFLLTHFIGQYPSTSLFSLFSPSSPSSSSSSSHSSSHSSLSLLPDLCHQEYHSALVNLVRSYSSSSSLSSSSHSPSSSSPSVCHICRLSLPLRAKHCKETNQCLLTFDHYCYFIWTPIYRLNYCYFFGYLIAMVLYIPLFLFTSISFIRYHQPSSKSLSYFLIWCFIQWCFVCSLLYYMTQSISLGQTTCERIKKPAYLHKRNPFQCGSWGRNFQNYWNEMSSFDHMSDDKFKNKQELNENCHIYFHVQEINKI